MGCTTAFFVAIGLIILSWNVKHQIEKRQWKNASDAIGTTITEGMSVPDLERELKKIEFSPAQYNKVFRNGKEIPNEKRAFSNKSLDCLHFGMGGSGTISFEAKDGRAHKIKLFYRHHAL